MVMIDYKFMYIFVKRLIQYSSGLSGSQYISMVLRYCMSTNVPYIAGHVVDHERDNNPIESYVIHFPYVGLVERVCLGLSCYDPRPP
jgi:hypothetical protein